MHATPPTTEIIMLPFHPFDIRKTIAETVNVNPDDTLRTKRALGRLGYYEPPKSHENPSVSPTSLTKTCSSG